MLEPIKPSAVESNVDQTVARTVEAFDPKIAIEESKLKEVKKSKQTDDLIKQEVKKFKQTDKLIKAVADLDKRLKGAGAGADKDGKTSGFFGTLKAGLKDKVSSVLSVQNYLGSGLLGTAYAAGRGLAADKKAKIEETQRRARAILKNDPNAPTGDDNERMRWATEQVLARNAKQDRVGVLEKEQKDAEEVGLNISGGNLDELKQLRTELRPPGTSLVDKNPKKKGEPQVDPLAKVRTQVDKRGDPIEQELLAKYDKQQAEKAAKGVVDSDNDPIKESEDIQLKQLAALKTLVANTTLSEEDRLESKKPETNTIAKEQKGKTEEKSGLLDGLLGGLLDVGGGGGGAVAGLKKMFPLLARLLPILANPVVLAVIAAAVALGTLALGMKNQKELWDEQDNNPNAPGLENNPRAMVKRGEAKSLAQAGKMNRREALKVLQPGTAKQYLEAGLDPETGLYLDGYSKEQLEQMAAGKYTGGKVVRTPPEKPTETPREVQAAQLEQNTKQSEVIAQKKAEGTSSAPATAIVNNTTVSNTTNTTRITPPVRNQDPSYNDRLRSTFV